MSSGRRESVLICCASVFRDLYFPSIDHYRPDRTYIFLSDGDDPVSRIERRVFDSCRENIRSHVDEVVTDVHDYENILARIMDIKGDMTAEFGDDLDIFINVTSGTHEFAAAGMFAAMTPVPAVAFRVETECSISEEDLESVISSIESCTDVSEPVRVTCLESDTPDRIMIGFLSIIDSLYERNRRPNYRKIISALKERDIWTHDPERKSNYGRTPMQKKEEMYLLRQYVKPALSHGWLIKPSANTLALTEKGRSYISVFGSARMNALSDEICRNEALTVREMRCLNSCSVPECDECDPGSDAENVVSFDRNGMRYRFRIGRE